MIREQRTVAAPAELIHDLLVDVSAWPLWSPHILWTDPPSGRVVAGWQGRVRPWFGPATTMRVTEVTPGRGMRWRTRALGHELRYRQEIEPAAQGCVVTFSATVHGPAASLIEKVAARLSATGQRRRLERLALLADRLPR